VTLPHQGHRRFDLTSRPLRFQTIRNYLIAYAPDEKPSRCHRRDSWSPQSSDHGGHLAAEENESGRCW
jgi:hypothetical protein